MPLRSMPLVVLAGLLFAGGALAESPREPGCPTVPKLTTRTYQVADLLVFDNYVADSDAKAKPEQWLVDLLMEEIAPASWSQRGGAGTIEYFPLGMAIVVHAAPPVHDAIGEMLRQLRSASNREVAVEIRILSVPPEQAERLARYGIGRRSLDDHGQLRPGIDYLSDREIWLLLEWLQQYRQTNVMQAPKVTLLNGQTATLQIDEGCHTYLSGVQLVEAGGSVVFVPQCQSVPLGMRFSVRTLIGRDMHSVKLKLNAQLSSLVSPTDTIANFYRPEVNTLRLDQQLTLADGQTALFSGWEFKHEKPGNILADWLRLVPIVQGWLEPEYAKEHFLVLVTPRIMQEPEPIQTDVRSVPVEATPAMGQPSGQEAVNKLLARYRDACEAGRHAEARALAVEALKIDPTCFGEK